MINKGEIADALISLDEKKVRTLVEGSINSGTEPGLILKELQDGLNEIGKMFEMGKMYVPELIFAGIIMKNNMAVLKPLLKSDISEKKGIVIIGTVYGDVHDIGKDIVKTLLEGSGFDVKDLGTNVEPIKFVEAIRDTGASVVGLSALLTISFDSIANTVTAIKESGIRDKVKIMVGGAPVTDLVAKNTGCDFYGKDAYDGLKYSKRIYGV